MHTINKNIFTLLTGLVIVGGLIYLLNMNRAGFSFFDKTPVKVATSTIPSITILPYGKVTLSIGETAQFKNYSIKLVRVFDDSRCQKGVVCIWAGTVKAEVESRSGLGVSTQVIEIGKSMTTEAEKITLLEVTPYPAQDTTIEAKNYKATFEVLLKEQVVTEKGKCYIGGCSSQICSDKPGVISNCMYQESYACYKTATCERQKNGICGWTPSKELQLCLSKY